MPRDTPPTNERILSTLEAISRELREVRDAQEQLATDLKRIEGTLSR